MDTINIQNCGTRGISQNTPASIRRGRLSQKLLGKFHIRSFLSLLFLILINQELQAGAADDLLKSIVEMSQSEETQRVDLKALRDQLKENHPNSDQAAIGEWVYMGFLADEPGVSRTDEMNEIFQQFRQKGESKWYVVAARIELMCAYSQEAGKMPAAKALAQEGIHLINVAELKTSYNNLIGIMKASFGAGQFTDVDTDVGAWMNALQITANSED